MKYSKEDIWQETKDYISLFIGLTIYALGFTAFILPYQITTGGLSGVSAIIYYATGFPVQYTYFLVNAALLIAAIKILGFRFCLKTIVGTLALTFEFDLFQKLLSDESGQLPMILGDQTFMACVLGACCEGVGLAIVFLSNGSTGGTDIIAAIVNKYREITFGTIILICDLIIITSSYFVLLDWERVLYGYVTLCVCSYTIDVVINMKRSSVQFIIISAKYLEISKRINYELHRGVTIIDGTGAYTGADVKMMFVLTKRRESYTVFQMIKEIDPNAFVSQSAVIGVYGKGFDHIKG